MTIGEFLNEHFFGICVMTIILAAIAHDAFSNFINRRK